MIKPGTVIYWTDEAPDAPDKAREFCRSRGLTADDVRIVKRRHGDDMMVMVEVKRPCKLKER